MTGATPCCHTQLTPVMWSFGSAVRVLDTALRSWRSAALFVSKHTPPSLHLHLHLSQRRNRTTRGGGGGEDDTVCDCNRGTPFPARPPSARRSASRTDPSLRWCVPLIPPAAPRRSVPRRVGSLVFPHWRTVYSLESG